MTRRQRSKRKKFAPHLSDHAQDVFRWSAQQLLEIQKYGSKGKPKRKGKRK